MTSTPYASTETVPMHNQDVRFHRSLCWGAILAGVATAWGIHLLLLALGAGIGLSTFTPLTDQNPGESFTVGAAIAWSLCALVALYVGGWVTGTFSAGPKTASIHGIVVWSVTMIITFALVSSGSGLALGGAVKALGAGLGMTGRVAASGASDLANSGVQQSKNQLSSFVDEAQKSAPTNTSPGKLVRGQREISFAVTKLFAPGQDIHSPENQAALAKALAEYDGMSEADAKNTINEWMVSYQNLRTELARAKDVADEKARESAQKAAKNLACAATATFFALVIGLIMTLCGAICGARKTVRHTTLGVIS